MNDSIELSWTVSGVTAARLWSDWLTGYSHSAMTDADATGEAKEGSSFTAWGGYISGTVISLEPQRSFVQSWRTLDFKPDAADSRLEVSLADSPEGCVVTVRHSDLPEGDGPKYHQGWLENYAAPMAEYYED